MIFIGSLLLILFVFGLIYFVDLIRTYFTIEQIFFRFLMNEKNQIHVSEDFFSSLLDELSKIFYSSFSIYYKIEEQNIKLAFYNERKNTSIKKFFNTNSIRITMKEKEKIIKMIIKDSLKNKMVFFNKNKKIKYKNYLLFPILTKEKELESFYIFFFNNPISLFRAKKIFFLSNRKLKNILINIHSVIRSRKQSIISTILGTIRDYAFLILDTNFYISNWNFGAQMIFGYKNHEIIGKSFEKLNLEISKKDLKKAFKDANNDKITKIKLKMIDFEGREVFCEVLIKSLETDGVLSGYTVLIKDETKTKVLKESIEKNSAINRAIVENNRDGVILLNKNDKIIYLNEKIKKIMETTSKSIGMDIAQIFSLQDSKMIKEKINEIRDTGFEFNFLDLKIGKFWYNIRLFKIKKDINNIKENTYNGVILFFIDTTYRIKTRMELESKQKELENKKEELEIKNKNLLENIESARMMQKSLIPKKDINKENFSIDAFFKLSSQLGGDFYYFEEVKIFENKFYPVLVTDVSGHGVAASMLTVLVKDIYNEFKENAEKTGEIKPEKFVNLLNQKLNQLQIEGSTFITVFFSIFNLNTKQVTYSSAGHPPMVQLKENGNFYFYDVPNSPPVGLFEDFIYKQKKEVFDEKDLFLIYTDGILDLFPDENSYLKGFEKFISENSKRNKFYLKKMIEKKTNEITSVSKDEMDDTTIVFVEVGKRNEI